MGRRIPSGNSGGGTGKVSRACAKDALVMLAVFGGSVYGLVELGAYLMNGVQL